MKRRAQPKAFAKRRDNKAGVRNEQPLTGDVGVLLSLALPRIRWLGDKDEASDFVSALSRRTSKESRAKAEEALGAYLKRMQFCSPLAWFRENDALLSWNDALADPLHVILDFSPDANGEMLADRVVNAETVPVFLEEVLVRSLRNGDTCGEMPRALMAHSALKYVFEHVPDDRCDWPRLEARFEREIDTAYASLFHIRSGGRCFTSSGKRGAMDYKLATYLSRRTRFFSIPVSDVAIDTTLTQEQRSVFGAVLEHLQRLGWAVLSGPGGSGKTHMLRSLCQALGEHKISLPGEGADCPRCAHPRMVIACEFCNHVRDPLELRHVRIALMAPTNRAVAVLHQATGAESSPFLLCGTIHSVTRRSDLPTQDVIIIDEASMMASEHADLLLNCNAFAGAAWLLVGDHLQLPPVGDGELLRPLLRTSTLPALRTNMRARCAQLASLIAAVREGRPQDIVACTKHCKTVGDLLQTVSDSKCDLVLCVRNEERIRYNAFEIQRRPCGNSRLIALDDYRRCVPDATMLTAPRSFVPFVGLPVRVQTNELKPRAQRGSLGHVQAVSFANKQWTLEIATEDSVATFTCPFYCIPEFVRPAYATTLHDAQGAQRPRIGIVLPPSRHCPLLNLEMLYTAVSRAQDELIVFTAGDTLTDMLPSFALPAPMRMTPFALQLQLHEDKRAEPASCDTVRGVP
jgi:hypothetical protein